MAKRVLWTLGMTFVGLLLAGKGGAPGDGGWVLLGGLWSGSIGFGFGYIFDTNRPVSFKLIIAWAVTLGLVAVFFGLMVSAGPGNQSGSREAISIAVSFLIGASLGTLIGTFRLWLHRRSQLKNSAQP